MSDFDKWMVYLILKDIKIDRWLARTIVIGFILFLIVSWILAKIMGY